MLAGPPRLVSLISIVLLLGLGWWYLRLIHASPSSLLKPNPNSGLNIDTTPPPTQGFKSDGVDFTYPPLFKEGVAKPAGENYTYVLVIPKTVKEDITWMRKDMLGVPLVVYEVE
jgi:hypothetical protein